MKKLTLLLLLIAGICQAQELTRRADWEAKIQGPVNGKIGATVASVESGSPLEKAGLRAGDQILKVNGKLIDSSESWTSAIYSLRTKEVTSILIKRDLEVQEMEVMLNPLPLETHPGIDTYYESLTNDYGITQRVIITKPKGVNGKLPAIILIQGLSCSTTETYRDPGSNWTRNIRYMVENSNMVMLRIEKPGVGDSEGDCATTDFETELNGYRAAAEYLKSKSYVDTSRIVVYGSSMGSALAPVLANEFNLAGVISDGTFFKTWFEHMLEIERRIRKMSGDTESEIIRKMNEAYIPLYYGMLVQKKSYQEVIDEYPAIAEYNYHSPAHMYGRPVEYYQQLQDFDLAGAWEKVQVPVRILYGMNDWIMSEFDNDMIIDVLERAGHEDHELVKYPGLDHWNTIHKTPDDSFTRQPGEWTTEVSQLVVDWAKEMVK